MWYWLLTAFVLGWCAGWVCLGLFGAQIAVWLDAREHR